MVWYSEETRRIVEKLGKIKLFLPRKLDKKKKIVTG